MTNVKVTYKRDHAKRSYKTYGANEYPDGSVPDEDGWNGDVDSSISRIPGNNKITVCRVKRKQVTVDDND